ncbi:MAG: phospholipase D-like domain-containing protein [Euryarchaeota archaeon]|nr:phospholipase D-like domain-containing protein [Euryarchaeota archaeon]
MQTKSIIGMIKGAKNSVYVEQLYIYKDWGTYADPKPNPLLEAVINASRRGCEVKILLDSKYGKEHNEETIEYVNAIATDEGLNLEAKLINNEAIELNKTHTKGVIVDRSEVLISSINWNEYSPTNNREVGLIIENEDVAEFYTDVFLYDWYDGSPVKAVFDTGLGTYPSIMGTHNGTITPSCNITVSKLYTYPCLGTGGHSEYVRLWNSTDWNVTATWNGYVSDWHNISFDAPFTLLKDEMYNYTIITGSYPQIHHNWTLTTSDGVITCSDFVDANGNVHNDWIPAIKLWA